MRAPSWIVVVVLLAGLLGPGGGEARAEDAVEPSPEPVRRANRLAGERSPYLRQHAHNPVDWRPWGPEAFEAARTQDKPVFLSIGYAACHWCHVMERESFEDEEAASVLNEVFVCVKVDREERPDVDDVYMAAVQLTTGHGGWPMSVFLLPDARPFLARTYLPREALIATAQQIGDLWRAERPRIVVAAAQVAQAVRDHAAGPRLPPFSGSDADLVAAAVRDAASSFDRERGGFDRVPKFPPHAHLLALLDRRGALGGEQGLEMARRTLDAMAAGGMHDHVGGGFHRYSTDERWLVPHFEKMLYDNALLAQAYARAFGLWGDPGHADAARGALGWVLREMTVEGGGYASSLDADTEGEEGLTYTWTPQEVRAALPPDLASLAEAAYGVVEGGNYREEASGHATGRSILHRPEPTEALARRLGRPAPDLEADLSRARVGLLAARARRPQPARDGKVIVAWNGLLLSAFAAAGVELREPGWLDRGRTLARFLLDRCRADGGLLRFPADSGPRVAGFLDDHVHLAQGLLDLSEATGDASWADEAAAVGARVLEDFRDPAGGFWSSSARHEVLLARARPAFDDPIPSPNATAARLLLRLAVGTGDSRWREAADATLAAFRPVVARAPSGTFAFVRATADRLALEAAGVGPASPDSAVRQGAFRVEAFLGRATARPGSAVPFALRVTLDEGWHAEPPDTAAAGRVPASLRADAPAPARPSGVRFAAAEGRSLEGTFWVRGRLEVPDDAPLGPRKVVLVLTAQACDASSCRPPEEIRVPLALRFAEEDGPALHPALIP